MSEKKEEKKADIGKYWAIAILVIVVVYSGVLVEFFRQFGQGVALFTAPIFNAMNQALNLMTVHKAWILGGLALVAFALHKFQSSKKADPPAGDHKKEEHH